ncbi:MAG TPA: hypothetical protein VHF89_04420 [Solirubrobacteraceae bacterium]|nr:hypothetical protein [Solirubrobacteraceae bacterium]
MARRHRIAATVAAGALGLSLAACGDEEGSRENVERGNLGNTSEGPQTVETGPTTLGSTGETQPTVDQVPTTP